MTHFSFSSRIITPHSLTPSHPHTLTPSLPHPLTPSHPHPLTPSHPHTHRDALARTHRRTVHTQAEACTHTHGKVNPCMSSIHHLLTVQLIRLTLPIWMFLQTQSWVNFLLHNLISPTPYVLHNHLVFGCTFLAQLTFLSSSLHCLSNSVPYVYIHTSLHVCACSIMRT